jgi:hypothetical protein
LLKRNFNTTVTKIYPSSRVPGTVTWHCTTFPTFPVTEGMARHSFQQLQMMEQWGRRDGLLKHVLVVVGRLHLELKAGGRSRAGEHRRELTRSKSSHLPAGPRLALRLGPTFDHKTPAASGPRHAVAGTGRVRDAAVPPRKPRPARERWSNRRVVRGTGDGRRPLLQPSR